MHRNQTLSGRRMAQLIGYALAGVAVFWLVLSIGAQPAWAQVTPTPAGASSTYVVRSGDSWTSVAARFGLSVAELQTANPGSVRNSTWLLVGEKLVIPTTAQTAPTATTRPAATASPTSIPPVATSGEITHIVQAGESWNSIAQKYQVPVRQLQRANPDALRADEVLFRGVELIIPPPEGSAATTATPTVAATATAVEATTATIEATPSAAPVTATEVVTPAEATAPEEPTCPETFAAYPAVLESLAKGASDAAVLVDFLTSCQALDEEGVLSGDWTGGGEDLALVLMDSASDAATPITDLLIFNRTDAGYTLAYRARAAGQVRVLAAEDLNSDGKADLVWVDTTCGASTCFDTVNVRTWDGSNWRDWTAGTITMAYADIQVDDFLPETAGKEIQLRGGVFGSVGAGPQRTRTELWSSADGAPYALADKVYDSSSCLLHKVQDADEALRDAEAQGLAPARELYTEAVTDQALTQCWERDGELAELRSYSLFRLAVVAGYEGQAGLAAENVAQMAQAFPTSLFTQMGQTWLERYQADGDIAAACKVAAAFAAANPSTYLSLSDYGYANPIFAPEDLCPVLALTPPPPAEGAEASEVITPTAPVPATDETTPAEPAPAPETTESSATNSAPSLLASDGELPDCPATLDQYANVLPAVIQVSGADPIIVETWLRLCDGMADDRGGMMLEDFNGDGVQDALFLPTIVSDLGFGPDGRQGAVLLYHGQPDGSYQLVYAPEIYGQPTLAPTGDGKTTLIGDVNGDGRADLAWLITGCSTFCVDEVQIVTLDPDTGEYISIIDPGATITEGEARFEALPPGALGQGKQLVLVGGVSGTAEGGLDVPHAEAWQSIDGGKFQRLGWTYDREVSGANCLGLRLVEADMMLQAADLVGYAPAVALYQVALDPELRACSIYGVPAAEELLQLRGLAFFRLIQTQAFSGTLDAATATLATMEEEQPESAYTQAASQWLAAFQASGDPAAACARIQPIFDNETTTWQLTDHFGINHPALGPEQICFVPTGQ